MLDADFEARGADAVQSHPHPADERAALLEELSERYARLVRMDNADAFIIGVCHRFGAQPHLAYDLNAVLVDLQRQGMSAEEAKEWSLNMMGAYVGETTPCFIDVLPDVRPLAVPSAPHGGLQCLQ